MLDRAMLAAVMGGVLATGCGMVDPERPAPYPDTIIYGNFLESTEMPDTPGAHTVRLQIGIPRALTEAKESEGRATPTVEKGTVADITVGADTVVVKAGRDATLADFDPGTEVVVLPVMGTTRMVGEARILVEASHLMDFVTYRRWKLPGLHTDEDDTAANDVDRINTPGIEQAPVVVDSGRVLYFTARLRLPVEPDGPLIGPRRPGLGDSAPPVERTYRTQLADGGWTAPGLVSFPGADEVASVSVSWVDDAETLCLVTVRETAELPWVGRSERRHASDPWGAIERLSHLGDGHTADGVYMAGSRTKMGLVVRAPGFTQTDLSIYDPAQGDAPLLLGPNINTPSDEWGPRIGPDNELFFCRTDRQMVLSGGAARPLRLPGPHRRIITQAAPTADGRWVFFCSPGFTAAELDQDIYVAEWVAPDRLGEPVTVDDWRPE